VVGRGDVVEALVLRMAVVFLDQGFDLVLEIAQQKIVTHQEPIFQRLMPELDLARCLWIMQIDFFSFHLFSLFPH